MNLSLKHAHWDAEHTRGEIYNGNLLLCKSLESTPTVLRDGIYQVQVVVDGMHHRKHIAVVACDQDHSIKSPYIFALFEPSTVRRSEVVSIAPDDYEQFHIAVMNCLLRGESIILYASSLYV